MGEETELKPEPESKCEEYLDQIENLVYENRKYLKELELLQQENFSLRRKCQLSEECNKSQVFELQSEISFLKSSLVKQDIRRLAREGNMDSTARENELKEQIHKQNKRLNEEE